MVVSKIRQEGLVKRMKALNLKEEDLVESFILGSGKGGQKINKTSSCVYLKHLPSNIEIKCQQERSRDANRFFARQELCERLEKRLRLEKLKLQQEKEKKRRQNRRPGVQQKAEMRKDKEHRAYNKSMRKFKDE